MFSGLKEKDRIKIIENSFCKLLKLVKKKNIKVGISITGISLEIINTIKPEIINELRKLIEMGNVEIIASGYSQVVQPLVPYEINKINLKLGISCYKSILNTTPNTAINCEGVYSNSAAKVIEEYKFKNLLVEWNNFYKANDIKNIDLKYKCPQIKNTKLNLIWYNSINFQLFQRYVKGEINLKDYFNNIKTKNKKGYICLYCSDAEIFGFNFKRYDDDKISINPWKRIESLINEIPKKNLIFTSEIKKTKLNNKIEITNFRYPLIVKKQDKYNIYRWSNSGKNDSWLNAICFKIFYALKNKSNNEIKNWKKLLYFWSSDFRTHIVNERWTKLMAEIKNFTKRENIKISLDAMSSLSFSKKNHKIKKIINFKNNTLTFDRSKGMSIKNWKIKKKNTLGTSHFYNFEEIFLGADFYSGNSLIEPLGGKKISDLKNAEIYFQNSKKYKKLNSCVKNRNYNFLKSYTINKKINNSLQLETKIITPRRSKERIRLLGLTFDNKIFDKKSLYYSTNLGGKKLERFKIKDNIDHYKSLNQNITAFNGFVATDGLVIIGDKKRKILVKFDQSLSFLVCQLIYYSNKKIDKYFLRLNFSAQEIDETFRENNKKQKIYNKFNLTWN